MPNRYLYGAYTDIGTGRENNEDYVDCIELDDENLFCVIADGTGSRKEYIQPASIVVDTIKSVITEAFDSDKEVFLAAPQVFMKLALNNANRVIGGFKMGNEEIYSGYASSVTCCLLSNDNKLYIAHTGNTRAYLMRDGAIHRFTNDHTKAAELLADGLIDPDTYYVTTDRLRITSGLGYDNDPKIQIKTGRIRDNDLILMTTDGVHYAVRPEFFPEIILSSPAIEAGARNLCEAAISTRYPDNCSAIIVVKKPNA